MRTCSIPGFHTLIPKPSVSVSTRQKFGNRSSSQPISSTALQVLSQTRSPLVPPCSSVASASEIRRMVRFKKRQANHKYEKVYDSESPRLVEDSAWFVMNWGVQMESAAMERYKRIMGCEVGSMGFALHSQEQFHWLGASPDARCRDSTSETKGRQRPWSKVPFYYMPQMEIMDREWVDLYCWTLNGSSVFRVMRDRSYWRIIYDLLREFWWENVIPALLLGKGDAELKKFI